MKSQLSLFSYCFQFLLYRKYFIWIVCLTLKHFLFKYNFLLFIPWWLGSKLYSRESAVGGESTRAAFKSPPVDGIYGCFPQWLEVESRGLVTKTHVFLLFNVYISTLLTGCFWCVHGHVMSQRVHESVVSNSRWLANTLIYTYILSQSERS